MLLHPIFFVLYLLSKCLTLGVLALLQFIDLRSGGAPGKARNILCRLPCVGLMLRRFPAVANLMLYNPLVSGARRHLDGTFAWIATRAPFVVQRLDDALVGDARCAACLSSTAAETRAVDVRVGDGSVSPCALVELELRTRRKMMFDASARGEAYHEAAYRRHVAEGIACSVCGRLPKEGTSNDVEIERVVRDALGRRDEQLQKAAEQHRLASVGVALSSPADHLPLSSA